MTSRRRGLPLRLVLTLSYSGFLLLAGGALFAAGLLMLRFVPVGDLLSTSTGGWAPGRADLVDVYVKYASWALAVLTLIGLGGGWLLSGWILAPLARITTVVRDADATTLDRRIALPGARNELTELADAFDGMLDRIERTVAEEGRFAANASHELRTPHAVIRTIVEVARADPDGRDVEVVLARIAETNERAIATTEALLVLARAGRAGIERRPVDLASTAADALDERIEMGAAAPLVRADLAPSVTRGDPALIRQLCANLVANAMTHNIPTGGEVLVRTGTAGDGSAFIEVSNSGAVLASDTVTTLTEPFVRASGRGRRPTDGGVGLGLTIVAAVVRSHGGDLELRARDAGGLIVRAGFPAG